jgi:hypothetical protein
MDHHAGSLIFLHIPKAAGTTLHAIIEAEYGPDAVWNIDRRRWREALAAFAELPAAARQKVKVFKGHMEFGLHRHLPFPARYLTMLRHPVDRVVSNYYYILRAPEHPFHEEMKQRPMSLREYVANGTQQDNGQTRLLSGAQDLPFLQCTRVHLETAKANLREHFAAVGLAERFDESLLLFQREFGWRRPYYTRKNVTENRPALRALPAGDLAVIESLNALDVELYAYARGLYREHVRSLSIPLSWKTREFRFLNRVNAGLATSRALLRGVKRRIAGRRRDAA